MIWSLKTLAVSATLTTMLVAGTAWYSYSKGEQSGMRQVEIQWQEAMRLQANAEAEELMKARQREEALATLLVKQRMEHSREVNRLVRQHAALVDSLRNRPQTRAGDSGVPEGATAGVGCTGAGLARDDAAFLAGYASDAGRLQLALQVCQAAYDQVRESINGAD
jgi:hypothetical protein